MVAGALNQHYPCRSSLRCGYIFEGKTKEKHPHACDIQHKTDIADDSAFLLPVIFISPFLFGHRNTDSLPDVCVDVSTPPSNLRLHPLPLSWVRSLMDFSDASGINQYSEQYGLWKQFMVPCFGLHRVCNLYRGNYCVCSFLCVPYRLCSKV